MLTLTNSLRIEGYTVFRDDVPESNQFYVLPDKPDIAKDDKGRPIFSLVVYRRDEERIDPAKSAEDVGGGILTMTVELTVPEDKLRKIRGRLRALVYGDRAEEPENDVGIDVVPFTDGKVSIAIAGEQGGETGEDPEFVRTIVGAGKVSGIGANRKAVMAKLTQAGASLMSQLEKLRTLPINVQYELVYEHRLVGVTVEVWCDIQSSYTLTQTFIDREVKTDEGGYLDDADYGTRQFIGTVTEIMVESKTAGVKVIPYSSTVDQETLLALEKFGMDMLTREIEKAAKASSTTSAGVDRSTLTQYISTASNNFNFSLDRTMVLTRAHTPSANIANVFAEGVEDIISFVDLRTAFFAFLKIPIRVNADFARLPLDSVTVTVVYRREQLGGGGQEERVDSFNFTDGAAIQTFLAYANSLEDVRYDWSATVHYKGSPESYTLRRTSVKDNFLVVDVGALGMIQVDVGLGLVDLEKVTSANVSLRYASAALGRTLEQSFLLSRDKQSVLWTEVIHEEPGRYEYKVDWLRKDGQILPGEWQRSTSSRLRLDAPLPDRLAVSVVATGNFKDEISQVAVSLVYRDPDNAYVEEGALTFTDDKQMQSWTVDLRNPELRDYEYRYSIVYKDGVVRDTPEDGGWLRGEPGFIVVGERYGLEVELVPYLLTYPDYAKVAQVDLVYDDPAAQIHERGSFVFSKENSKPITWRVRTAPGGPKRYTVEVTYFSATGGQTRVGPRQAESEALVLEPPAPPPPPTPTPTPSPA